MPVIRECAQAQRAQPDTAPVTQTSKSAVSRVSQPANRTKAPAPPTWKSAIQQVWKPALPAPVLLGWGAVSGCAQAQTPAKNAVDKAKLPGTLAIDMKQSITTALLVGVFFISAVLTVVLSARYYFSMKELERTRATYAQVTAARAAMQSLAAEAIEFSRQNPSIESVLQEFKPKGKSGSLTNAPGNPSAPR